MKKSYLNSIILSFVIIFSLGIKDYYNESNIFRLFQTLSLFIEKDYKTIGKVKEVTHALLRKYEIDLIIKENEKSENFEFSLEKKMYKFILNDIVTVSKVYQFTLDRS